MDKTKKLADIKTEITDDGTFVTYYHYADGTFDTKVLSDITVTNMLLQLLSDNDDQLSGLQVIRGHKGAKCEQ